MAQTQVSAASCGCWQRRQCLGLMPSRADPPGQIPHLAQQLLRFLAEIEGVAEDLYTGAAHNMARRLLVALCIDEVTVAQAEDGAVSEELVQVGVRISGWLLCLVFGVDDGDGRAADLPDDVGAQRNL